MFKARLIEDQNYYKLRGKQALLILLPSIPIGLLVNFYQLPVWLTIIMIFLYLLILSLIIINQKSLNLMVGDRQVEINDNEIRIISKTETQNELINLDEVEKLILKVDYTMPLETMKEIGKEMSGNPNHNFLIYVQQNQKRRLDFEIDSYFMLKQLNNLIDSWIYKGYKVQRINDEDIS